MSTLTRDHVTRLSKEFAELKLTARGPADLKHWFKTHPYLIPKLAEQHHDFITINVSKRNARFDFDRNTKLEDYNFEFYIQSVPSDEQAGILKSITGFDFSADINKDTFFLSSYTDTLDANDWRFIAVDTLTNVAESELQSHRRVSVFKNLIETHFPHLSWDAYLGLHQADLLPQEQDAMWTFLHGRNIENPKLYIPHDLQP